MIRRIGKRRHAYTAIVGPDGYIIGRADEGVQGYTPVYLSRTFTTYQDAKSFADELNRNLGRTLKEAYAIILGTM